MQEYQDIHVNMPGRKSVLITKATRSGKAREAEDGRKGGIKGSYSLVSFVIPASLGKRKHCHDTWQLQP